MATLTLNLDVTAGELTRVVEALKSHLSLAPATSSAAVQAEFRVYIRQHLISIVKNFERTAAAKTAADAITEIAPS